MAYNPGVKLSYYLGAKQWDLVHPRVSRVIDRCTSSTPPTSASPYCPCARGGGSPSTAATTYTPSTRTPNPNPDSTPDPDPDPNPNSNPSH
eukprot:scaffold71646_cov54-Phaeocystis_antarctica.AAC.1